MHKMIDFMGNFTANVTFVGHSMGGLASINYGLDYAKNNPRKDVDPLGLSGRVVFLQHGLKSNKDEFKVMVAYMVQKKLKAANEHE